MGVYKNNNGNLELISGATLYADAPIGSIVAYGGATAPNGWLLCQGQAISRTDYAELFTVIGTAFGNGDGVNTFNLPDPRNKFLEGASTTNPVGTEKSAGLPNIKGGITGGAFGSQTGVSGAFNTSTVTEAFYNQTGNFQRYAFTFNANKSNSIYSDSVDTVQPPAVCTNYIIKAQQVALPADFMDALDDKQDATDNNLETTDKKVVGAINELKDDLTAISNEFSIENIQNIKFKWGADLQRFEIIATLYPANALILIQFNYDNTIKMFQSSDGGSTWQNIWVK